MNLGNVDDISSPTSKIRHRRTMIPCAEGGMAAMRPFTDHITAGASPRSKRIASYVAALVTLIIASLAMRSCTPNGGAARDNANVVRKTPLNVTELESPTGDGQRLHALSPDADKEEKGGLPQRKRNQTENLRGGEQKSENDEGISLISRAHVESPFPKNGANSSQIYGNKTKRKELRREERPREERRRDERRREERPREKRPKEERPNKVHRRLMQYIPAETKAWSVGKFLDPHTVDRRDRMPLRGTDYNPNPLIQPYGYPWHRWEPNPIRYPLDVEKFVETLARLGRGEDHLLNLTPSEYARGGMAMDPNEPRIHNFARPYIIRDGRVLRSSTLGGGAWYSLVEQALIMAKGLAGQDPRMKLLAEGDLPLIYDPNDYPWCGDDLVPIFRLNAIKNKACMHSWPTMSLTYIHREHIQLAESPYAWDDIMAKWKVKYPWEKKIAKAVWRGRNTGYTYRDEERPRTQMVKLASNHGDIMDIKLAEKGSTHFMKEDDFMKYRAIIDIDGNAWSARLGKLLCHNSVVVKVDSEYVGYWEKDLKPYTHYIPVQRDLSDLVSVVKYVVADKNQDQMRQIAKNSQAFCRMKLTRAQYTVDMLWILLAYAELVHNAPGFHEKWKRNIDAYEMPALNMTVC